VISLAVAAAYRCFVAPGDYAAHQFPPRSRHNPPLIDGLSFDALIADKACDSNAIIADLNERGAKIVISQHQRRTKPLPLDTEMYKWRHLIENFFCKLKEFKRIALRADKTDLSFNAIIHLAAAVINSR
jgi:transposase